MRFASLALPVLLAFSIAGISTESFAGHCNCSKTCMRKCHEGKGKTCKCKTCSCAKSGKCGGAEAECKAGDAAPDAAPETK